MSEAPKAEPPPERTPFQKAALKMMNAMAEFVDAQTGLGLADHPELLHGRVTPEEMRKRSLERINKAFEVFGNGLIEAVDEIRKATVRCGDEQDGRSHERNSTSTQEAGAGVKRHDGG